MVTLEWKQIIITITIKYLYERLKH